MIFEKVQIGELISPEYNPRKKLTPGDKEYQKIKKSIEEFGYVDPIIINNDNTIIGGNQRAQVLKDLGIGLVDVIKINIEKDKEKALNVALNKISGEWDNEKLAEILKELKDMEDDLNFSLTGFEEKEFNQVMADFEKNIKGEEDKEQGFDEEEAVKKAEEKRTKIKTGDLIQMGNHYLLCGDSFQEEDRNKILNLPKNNFFDMLFTDPPYAMEGGGGKGSFLASSTKNSKNRIDKIIKFDVMKLNFLPDLNIGSFYIFTTKKGVKEYFKIFDDFKIFNILIWAKSNPTPFTNNNFLPDVEYLMYFAKDKRIWNNQLKPTEIYKKYYLSKKEEGRKEDGDLHPTMKPIEMIKNRIMISSKENGKVLDLFGGSGSTMISCEQLGRSCYMIELEPIYCQVIVDRYIRFKEGKENDIFVVNNNKKIPWREWNEFE